VSPSGKGANLDAHLAAAAAAAFVNYPLWRASAAAQSGFALPAGVSGGPAAMTLWAFKPPWKGVGAVLFGMTWARAAIFSGSEYGKGLLQAAGAPSLVATLAPPLVVSTGVQLVNMPIIRASITLQNPECAYASTLEAFRGIYARGGLAALWHGTSAGVLKTVPKVRVSCARRAAPSSRAHPHRLQYCTAVLVKDVMDDWLDAAQTRDEELFRSAKKAVAAGLAGATLTNPMDVLRNEMFKRDTGLRETLRNLQERHGHSWLYRGIGKNMVSVAMPICMTIWVADLLIGRKQAAEAEARR